MFDNKIVAQIGADLLRLIYEQSTNEIAYALMYSMNEKGVFYIRCRTSSVYDTALCAIEICLNVGQPVEAFKILEGKYNYFAYVPFLKLLSYDC